MLGNYITIDGVSSRTLGLFCKQLPMFPVAVESKNSFSVGGRLDNLYQSSNFYNDIQLDIEAVLIGFEMDPIIRYFTNGKQLWLSNQPDRFAVIRQLVAIDQNRAGNGALELKITLKCSPFKYRANASPRNFYSSPAYFKTVGTVYSEPLIIAGGCYSDISIALNGVTVSTTGIADVTSYADASKNLCANNIVSGSESHGITATVNADKSVSLSGNTPSNADAAFVLMPDTQFPSGTYHVSGCPTGGATAKYRMDIVAGGTTYRDTGNGVEFTLAAAANVRANIVVYRNNSAPSDAFFPMICKKSAWEEDPEYTANGSIDIYLDVPHRVVYTVKNGEKTVIQEHTVGNLWNMLLVPSETEFNYLIFSGCSKVKIELNERWL